MEEIQNAAAAGETASAPAAETPAPKPLFRLNLDHDGVYWGATAVHAEDVKDGDVTLDHVPDNPGGRYKWNGTFGTLEPLPPAQVKTAQGAPTLEQAFHALVQSLKDAGHALPAAAHAWCEDFKKTLEAKG